jgi:hypothetical protein
MENTENVQVTPHAEPHSDTAVGSNPLLGAWWEIPHPGTGQKQRCSTFDECMEKWFEGYNHPVLVVDGKREDFATAIARVSKYYAAPNEKVELPR